jgi:hypothetical protein
MFLPGHRYDCGIDGNQGLPGRWEETLSGLGEAYSAAATLEELGAEQGFQPCNPAPASSRERPTPSPRGYGDGNCSL